MADNFKNLIQSSKSKSAGKYWQISQILLGRKEQRMKGMDAGVLLSNTQIRFNKH